jgi:hypothetical protein
MNSKKPCYTVDCTHSFELYTKYTRDLFQAVPDFLRPLYNYFER